MATYTEVKPTATEIAKYRKAKGHAPAVGMVKCDICGKRIWNSGLGRGAHNRAKSCAAPAAVAAPAIDPADCGIADHEHRGVVDASQCAILRGGKDKPEVVEVAVIDATPAETLQLLRDVAAKADAEAPRPRVGDRVRVTDGVYAERAGRVDRLGGHVSAVRVRFDGGSGDGDASRRAFGWVGVSRVEILPAIEEMTLAIPGSVNVHWGNDGRTACGLDGAEPTAPQFTEPDCHTCRTVWTVTR